MEHPFDDEKLIVALGQLLFKIKDHIDSYDTIISDEASGRLPSLLIKKVIDKKRHQEGKTSIPLHFIAGGHQVDYREKSISEFLEKNKNNFGKILIVTDLIATGISMRQLATIFKSCGVNDFEIATVSLANDPEEQTLPLSENLTFFQKNNIPLIYGDVGKTGHYSFYRKNSQTGVEKDILQREAFPSKSNTVSQNTINKIRGSIDILAEEFYQLIFGTNKK